MTISNTVYGKTNVPNHQPVYIQYIYIYNHLYTSPHSLHGELQHLHPTPPHLFAAEHDPHKARGTAVPIQLGRRGALRRSDHGKSAVRGSKIHGKIYRLLIIYILYADILPWGDPVPRTVSPMTKKDSSVGTSARVKPGPNRKHDGIIGGWWWYMCLSMVIDIEYHIIDD